MWELLTTHTYERMLKTFAKKRPNELTAMLNNLDTYVLSLKARVNPLQMPHQFIHRETHGCIAIDQRGCPGKPTQTRLYVYPDTDARKLYLLTIGDKKSQHDDNRMCQQFVLDLRAQKQNTAVEPTGEPNNQHHEGTNETDPNTNTDS